MRLPISRAAALAILSLAFLGADEASDRGADWVDERIAALQPTADERRIDRVGWAPDIRSALRAGADRGRPVFLFTMDGRFGIGRC